MLIEISKSDDYKPTRAFKHQENDVNSYKYSYRNLSTNKKISNEKVKNTTQKYPKRRAQFQFEILYSPVPGNKTLTKSVKNVGIELQPKMYFADENSNTKNNTSSITNYKLQTRGHTKKHNKPAFLRSPLSNANDIHISSAINKHRHLPVEIAKYMRSNPGTPGKTPRHSTIGNKLNSINISEEIVQNGRTMVPIQENSEGKKTLSSVNTELDETDFITGMHTRLLSGAYTDKTDGSYYHQIWVEEQKKEKTEIEFMRGKLMNMCEMRQDSKSTGKKKSEKLSNRISGPTYIIIFLVTSLLLVSLAYYRYSTDKASSKLL